LWIKLWIHGLDCPKCFRLEGSDDIQGSTVTAEPQLQREKTRAHLRREETMREGRVGSIVFLLSLSILIATIVVPIKAEEEYQITATIESPEQQSNSLFGYSVDIYGDIMVIGESYASVESIAQAGQAHIFDLEGNLKVTIQAPTPQVSAGFGHPVAIKQDLILVGEHNADIGEITSAGRAYIYNSDGSLQAEILSPTPMIEGDFGWALCFSGDTIVICDDLVGDMIRSSQSNQEVHLYDSDGNFLETLQSPEPVAGFSFAWSIDGGEGIFVVGEHFIKVGDTAQAGKAHIFDSDGDLLATLQSPEPQFNAIFGKPVAVSGDIVVVGEYWAEVEGNSKAGRAHIFDADGILLASLQSPEPEANAMFGWSVDTSGDLVLVCEPYANGESIDEGRVYVYDTEGNLLETLSSPELTLGTEFGTLVCVEGEIIVVGAPGASNERVYVFQPGAVDFTLSGLSVNPGSVNVGGTVTISVECSNEGSMSGSHTVTLRIDGEVEDEKTVTVAPDESMTVSFDAPTSEKGTYSVEIEGLTGSYEVRGGIPGFPVESLIAGLAVAILVLWARQRTS
jgi:hypothetical protein